MDSIKIIAFKNIQRYSMTIPVELTIKCSSCFYTILHVLIIAKYMIKIHFTYPSRWMLFLQALCMHPCHEEHRGQTKPSGLNWNKIINQIKSTYINIYAVCREGIFISLSIHLRLILTEACDNYDVVCTCTWWYTPPSWPPFTIILKEFYTTDWFIHLPT